MSKIRVLADHVANQIAAGEVVERPASVAKELVENAIDAGATHITIEIEAGGRRLLKVSDDGEGMVRDDAILAFERHATSKIRATDDLIAIGTLGFRGEALASIASVAKVELTTSTEDAAAATRVAIDGGRLRDVKDAAHPRGTTIVVRDLFFNVPARRKFLRAEATETFHLTNLVTHYALAHPEIAFTFVNNGRDVVRAVAAKDLRERAYQIFGAEFLENLLAVDGGDPHVARVTGFVSAPRDRRTTRDSQYLFVNRRFVRDRMIGRSLSEGYRSILPHGAYPAALLFIETPLEEVDVNVHPAKTEVRFRRSAAVGDAVREAVRDALASNDYVPQITTPVEPQITPIPQTQTAGAAVSFTPPQPRIEFVPPPPPQSTPAPAIPIPSGDEIARDVAEMIRVPSVKSVSPLPPLNSAERLVREVSPETLSSNIRPLGQLEESFIIATDDEGLLLIDQHVAHERVLFDKYRALEQERRTESQQLLVPETFDLTPAQAAVFDQLAPELEVYGFELMRLSGRTVAIKAVPADLPAGEARNMLSELLDTVDAERKSTARETMRDEIAASLACHAAIKVNMPLAPEKMRWLIDRLLQTSSPTTCPHGRPVILRLKMRDILKGFHRI
ncbi:MAG TPA: DNA mismatch repair endonuclease MutL [Pyrinomonadaceae bacterium]|nr:DNA mismatch repair endonuclease MutL [Pyrinomonadaceae bacterium]